jgi:hypothetical protein
MDIQTDEFDEKENGNNVAKSGFWKRQFQKETTKGQKVFDGIFGIILPVICFFFDPIVFRGNGAFLGAFKPFAYLLSYFSIMALLAFLLWNEKLKWLNGFLSGLFGFAALISTGIGILLFPFSLIGMVILIGFLGFTPLFTGFVFWRNAARTYKTAKPLLGTKLLANMMILSAILSFTIPEIINVKIQKGLNTIESSSVQTIRRTPESLRVFAPLLKAEPVSDAHYLEKDSEQKGLQTK